uniref:Uncharacterized protein n=1 Tax=Strix occidentalis caurina TaxID=311401 RepID=A0A8D0FGR7_STROC
MALLILRTRPRADVGISAFEMVYGMSYRIESPQTNVLIRDRVINEYVSQLAEHPNGNPHEPMLWKLYNLQESKLIQTRQGSSNSWNFTVHLFSMIPFEQGGCFGETCPTVSKAVAQCKAFYMCPASNPGKSYCNYPGHFFCGYWGCETIASDWDTTTNDEHITVTWGPPGCKPPQHGHDGSIYGPCGPPQGCWRIEIKVKQPEDDIWLIGRTWGIRYWEPGADRGSLFKIIKEKLPHDPLPVGPNLVLNPPTSSEEKVAPVQWSP